MTTKPQQVIDLEKFYQITLNPKEKDEISYWDNPNTYQLNEKGEVIGLNLRENKISDLRALSGLTGLTILVLDDNQISDLRALSGLTGLTILELNDNQISDLSALSGLTGLTELWLNNNQISDLSALSGLTGLTMLEVRNNKISDLSALSGLTGLTTLRLSGNQISDLRALSGLTGLTNLWLDDNQISDLRALSSLKGLTKLEVRNNKISDLLGKYPNHLELIWNNTYYFRSGINLYGNPLPDTLIGAIQAGKNAVDAYFEGDFKELREAKLMLLGEPRAGKTNLKNYLLGRRFEDDHDKNSTLGIEVDIWKPEEIEESKINIWDTGGQWVQQQVHKFFITETALYIIVLDKSREHNPKTWLEWIKVYAPNSDIIIVINKAEVETGNFFLDENYFTNKYPNIKAFHYISLLETNNKNNEWIDKSTNLKKDLLKYVQHIPSFKIKQSVNFFKLKEEIQTTFSGENKPYISNDYFKDIASKLGFTHFDSILDSFNKLGTLRQFEKQDKFILNPRWLSGGAYKILTDTKTIEQKGKISKQDVTSILCDNNSKNNLKYEKTDVDYITNLLKEFQLAYIDNETYYLPSCFEANTPDKSIYNDKITSPYLHYKIKYTDYYPDTYILRLIVKYLQKKSYNNDFYAWREGIFLEVENFITKKKTVLFINADKDQKTIEVKISGEAPQHYFSEFLYEIDELHRNERIAFEQYIVDLENGKEFNFIELLQYYIDGIKEIPTVVEKRTLMVNVSKILGQFQSPDERNQTIVNNKYNLTININNTFINQYFENKFKQLENDSNKLNAEMQKEMLALIKETREALNKKEDIKTKTSKWKAFCEKIKDEGIKAIIKKGIKELIEPGHDMLLDFISKIMS